MKKIYIIYGLFWILAVIAVIYSFTAPVLQTNRTADQSKYIKGEIIERQDDIFYVKLLDKSNNIIKTKLSDYFLHDDYEKGDIVSLYITPSEDGKYKYDIADYYHFDGLLTVFIIFCILTILIAKKKGLFSIISVVLSLIFFYALILNSVNIGIPMIPASLVYVFLITILTIPLIHGFNKKSLSAIIAVNAGYIIGFILTYFFTAIIRVGNTPSEQFRILIGQFPDIDIRQILIVSLFLGAVGALIDVAVTICSAIFEGIKEYPNLTFAKTYKLGMNVGKDILGSMINTLLLAYLAASFPFLVLMALSKFNNVHEFLNYDFITLELTRIFIGVASIVLLIPITAVISAYLVMKKTGLIKK